ncbi:hypothetical protein [Sphingopyxis bauzanensis]|uniref:hypothetical protein n=1 Tax=Sphingopyxis bauzanensis TaxID=651663 RepID=UPI001181B6F8|nr:hypothetical protein [Sphingopyxis bauzanensis]
MRFYAEKLACQGWQKRQSWAMSERQINAIVSRQRKARQPNQILIDGSLDVDSVDRDGKE